MKVESFMYNDFYTIPGYTLIASGNVIVDNIIEYIAFDRETDDFDNFAILPGIYEYRVYNAPGGYRFIQLVIDDCEIDIPDGYYIVKDTKDGDYYICDTIYNKYTI